jgi:hypothetical protein
MSRLGLRGCWVLAWAAIAACSSSSGTVASAGAGASGSAGASSSPSEAASRIAPRIRRAEYDATVQALLGTKQALGSAFVPDARLYKYGKFDRNEAQIVEPVLARQLQQAAEKLALEYVATQLDQVLPCASQPDAACAAQFFQAFLPKAYRRGLFASELDDLLSMVVTPAIARDGFRAAVALGIEAALQSAPFLYHTELGAEGSATDLVTLTNAEIADAIAYLLTGGPADAQLASAPDLTQSASREAEARRLLQSPGARLQVRRMVKQWLDIDQIGRITKDIVKFPNFEPSLLDKESNDFIEEVVFTRRGDFEMLIGADFTVGDAWLAEFYGAPPPSTEPGIIDLSGLPRKGLLNRGAFLASYATPTFPAPVKRGARVLSQALCLDPGDPNAVMLRIALPPPNSAKTTRQRFEEHSQAACAGCHGAIDSVGYSFEHFNAIGAWEANEDGKPDLPIDSKTTLRLPIEIPFGTQTITDSSQLAALVGKSETGRRCFARNLARFTTATYGATLEQGFIDEWKRLAAAGQDNVQELLVAYVRSAFFIERDRRGGAP